MTLISKINDVVEQLKPVLKVSRVEIYRLLAINESETPLRVESITKIMRLAEVVDYIRTADPEVHLLTALANGEIPTMTGADPGYMYLLDYIIDYPVDFGWVANVGFALSADLEAEEVTSALSEGFDVLN